MQVGTHRRVTPHGLSAYQFVQDGHLGKIGMVRAFQTLSAAGSLASPEATEITSAGDFWPAEDYHQQYLAKRGMGSCHI